MVEVNASATTLNHASWSDREMATILDLNDKIDHQATAGPRCSSQRIVVNWCLNTCFHPTDTFPTNCFLRDIYVWWFDNWVKLNVQRWLFLFTRGNDRFHKPFQFNRGYLTWMHVCSILNTKCGSDETSRSWYVVFAESVPQNCWRINRRYTFANTFFSENADGSWLTSLVQNTILLLKIRALTISECSQSQ